MNSTGHDVRNICPQTNLSERSNIKKPSLHGEVTVYTESNRWFTGVPSPPRQNEPPGRKPLLSDHNPGLLDSISFVASAQTQCSPHRHDEKDQATHPLLSAVPRGPPRGAGSAGRRHGGRPDTTSQEGASDMTNTWGI